MAVKEQESLYEEDFNGRESSYIVEEEEKKEEEEAAVKLEEELRELHKRISQTSYPLNAEALGVLHTALHSSTLFHDDSLLSPLLLQLRSLKSRIPPIQGDEGSTSTVVIDALNYLEQLSKLKQGLKEDIQELTSLIGCSSKDEVSQDHVEMVNVESLNNNKLHVLIKCKKREGLLSSLILSFDTLGLIIEQMDTSCDDGFRLEVITTQVGENTMDDEMVKKVLVKVVREGYKEQTKI